MIALVITYCLAADQSHCVQRRDPFDDWEDPVACMEAAQIQAQQYLRDHPNWRLTRWSCEVNVPPQEQT